MSDRNFQGDVVVIDNDNDNREATTKSLAELGYQVTQCIDGNQCIRLMERQSWKWTPKIIFVDSILPGISSFELVRRLNTHFEKKDTVLIMTSKYNAPEDAMEANSAGAAGFVVKPINQDSINTILAKIEEKKARLSKSVDKFKINYE